MLSTVGFGNNIYLHSSSTPFKLHRNLPQIPPSTNFPPYLLCGGCSAWRNLKIEIQHTGAMLDSGVHTGATIIQQIPPYDPPESEKQQGKIVEFYKAMLSGFHIQQDVEIFCMRKAAGREPEYGGKTVWK